MANIQCFAAVAVTFVILTRLPDEALVKLEGKGLGKRFAAEGTFGIEPGGNTAPNVESLAVVDVFCIYGQRGSKTQNPAQIFLTTKVLFHMAPAHPAGLLELLCHV